MTTYTFLQAFETRKWPLTLFLLLSSYAAALIIVKGLGYHDFLFLTPFNLLLSLALLIWFQERKDARFWYFLALAWAVGFGIEVAGVNTGAIFGQYAYGDILGVKVAGAPLMIGVNWILVVFSGNEFINRWMATRPPAARAVAGAIIPVALDWLIEPVAIRYDMWTWESGNPPLQNFIAWYFVALGLSLAYQYWIGTARNPVALLLLILQIIFFSILTL